MDTILSAASIGAIVAMVQLGKRILPAWRGEIWLVMAFVLGMFWQMVIHVILNEPPDFGLRACLILATAGIINGLAASKSYDEVAMRDNAVGRAVRGLAGGKAV